MLMDTFWTHQVCIIHSKKNSESFLTCNESERSRTSEYLKWKDLVLYFASFKTFGVLQNFAKLHGCVSKTEPAMPISSLKSNFSQIC